MYFKIKVGYAEDEYISIDDTELETALDVFINDKKGVFTNGVCRGKDIIAITEDYNKEMGWKPTHKLDADDWEELRSKGIERKYKGAIAEAKNVVQYLTETKQEHLIGKGYKISKIENPQTKQLEGEKSQLLKKLTNF